MNSPNPIERYRILFKGIVQGVGFRPYLYRTAQSYQLTGFVKNTSEGVILEVEGRKIEDFIRFTLANLPPLSKVVHHHVQKISLANSETFEIHPSENTDKSDLLVSPDIAICRNCKKELENPDDRRYSYPFINCTDCGPRLTIIADLPYDRPKTTMSKFPMCPQCGSEYKDPLDRRYHAQPVSCYNCGPTLTLIDNQNPDLTFQDPLHDVCQRLKEGQIAAIKGLGGFHLACLASSQKAVQEMRIRKRRKRKPFALMGTIEMIRHHCHLSDDEAHHLQTPSSPILLLTKKETSQIDEAVAPGQNTIGFMCPYTPLHLLLLKHIGEPLIMTSANISDEPIIYKDNHPLLKELAHVILTNDRDIYIFADDSVARVVEGNLYMIRRSRGYVPYPITMPVETDAHILGLGPMLKTTFTIWRGDKAISSPYIGTTDTPEAIEAQWFAIQHYMKLFNFSPTLVAMDKHPQYPNRLLAQRFPNAKPVEIQHHRAHVGSLMAEHNWLKPLIGIALDGTGYGDDGNIWGGEFFIGDHTQLNRFGHLKYLFLPAGDKSVKEPWRFALSVLHHLYGESSQTLQWAESIGKVGLQQLEIIKKGFGGIATSSTGRLFDAAAVLLGIGQTNHFDGDLPMQLQTLAEKAAKPTVYNYTIHQPDKEAILDFLPTIDDMLHDSRPLPEKALAFHATLAHGIAAMAEIARRKYQINDVGLTGGVFQNTLLLKLTQKQLQTKEFRILIHSQIPSNDGGISMGQVFLAK